MSRHDGCRCLKPHGVYGRHGAHWIPSEKYPDSPQMDEFVEPCPLLNRREHQGSGGTPQENDEMREYYDRLKESA